MQNKELEHEVRGNIENREILINAGCYDQFLWGQPESLFCCAGSINTQRFLVTIWTLSQQTRIEKVSFKLLINQIIKLSCRGVWSLCLTRNEETPFVFQKFLGRMLFFWGSNKRPNINQSITQSINIFFSKEKHR